MTKYKKRISAKNNCCLGLCPICNDCVFENDFKVMVVSSKNGVYYKHSKCEKLITKLQRIRKRVR